MVAAVDLLSPSSETVFFILNACQRAVKERKNNVHVLLQDSHISANVGFS
jgi:hypothetical protein